MIIMNYIEIINKKIKIILLKIIVNIVIIRMGAEIMIHNRNT